MVRIRLTAFPRPGTRFIALTALALAVALSGTAIAATITWNNATGGAWSNPANWTPNEVPDAAGETAVLPVLAGAYTVTLDTNPACDGLEIAAGGATLDVNGRTLLGIGLVTNAGAIANFAGYYDSDRIRNQAGGTITVADAITTARTLWNDGTLVLPLGTTMTSTPDSLDLDGDGAIALSGQINVVKTLEIGSGIEIQGDGAVVDRITVNHGLLEATGGTFFHPSGIENHGTIRVSNGAMLHVRSGFINNFGMIENSNGGGRLRVGWFDESMGSIHVQPGGRIVAVDGELEIHCGMLVRATLERGGETGTVKIVAATVENLVVAEGAEVLIERQLSVMTAASDVTNHGVIRLAGDMIFGAYNGTDEHGLVGSGKIVLEGGRLGISDGNVGHVTNYQRIEGCGSIGGPFTNEGTIELDCSSEESLVDASLVNRGTFTIRRGAVRLKNAGTVVNAGTIAANGGRVVLDGGVTVDNRLGSLQSNRGMVDLGAAGGGTVWGGRLTSSGDGLFGVGKVATLRDVTIAPGATVIVYGSTTLHATGARLANEGTVRVFRNATLALAPTTEYVQGAGLTSLEKGRIATTRELRIAGGALRGGGTIAGSVANDGLVIPDPAMGALRVEGQYRQGSAATFHAMLGGTTVTLNSRLEVTGAAILDGQLATSTLGSFHPASGTTFEVLASAARSGRFQPFREALPEGGLAVNALYGPGSVALEYRAAVSVDDSQRPQRLAFYGARTRGGASFVLELPASAVVRGRVYDAAGREVARLADGLHEAGVHHFAIGGGTPLASGVYFARMVVANGGASQVKTARVSLLQ